MASGIKPKRGRPPLAAPNPNARVAINARVAPATKAEIERQAGEGGIGKLLDRKFKPKK